jgi:hypothetical protein
VALRGVRIAGLALVAWLAVAAAPAHAATDWAQRALGLQYELAGDVGLANAPWVYTHNSFNSRAEMGPTLSDSDPNQRLSIVGQLDQGVRHLEIDTHLFPSPSDPRVGGQGPVVCHATGPAVGCTVEKPLVVVLREVRGWLAAHPTQVLMLYLESHLDTVPGYDAGADEVGEALGPLVYRPPSAGRRCDPMPMALTRERMRAQGKRVILIGPCGLGTRWPSYVFDEAPRITGSDNAPFQPFPGCGPDFTRAQYQAHPIRYYEDSTQLTRTSNGGATDPVTPALAARMIRCGVDLIGLDQLVPGDPRLTAQVWSWAPGQPGARGNCAGQRVDGRWLSLPCSQRHRVACRTDGGTWRVPRQKVRAVAAPRLCGSARYVNGVPRTGYEAQLLRVAVARAPGSGGVWLGYRRGRSGWRRYEKRGCGPTLRDPRRRRVVRHGVARLVVRLGFSCTGERLSRRVVIRGGRRAVRGRTGRLLRVPVGRHTRRLKVRYRYRGRRRTAVVKLRRG